MYSKPQSQGDITSVLFQHSLRHWLQQQQATSLILTLYKVLGLLGHISPGLAFKREVSLFDFLHDFLSTGVGQALLLTLKRHLARQHGVLQTEEKHTICCQNTVNTASRLKYLHCASNLNILYSQCGTGNATCLFLFITLPAMSWESNWALVLKHICY